MTHMAEKHTRAGRRRWGPIALALLVAGCGTVAPPANPPGTPVVAGAAGAADSLSIRAIELAETATGERLRLETSGPMVWTSYRDADGNLVVELPNARPSAAVAALELEGLLVESARVEVRDSGDRPLSRMVVRTHGETEHAVTAEASSLLVDLVPVGTPSGAFQVASVQLSEAGYALQEPAEPLPREGSESEMDDDPPMESLSAAADASGFEEADPTPAVSGSPDAPIPGPEPTGPPATRLDGVEVTRENGTSVV